MPLVLIILLILAFVLLAPGILFMLKATVYVVLALLVAVVAAAIYIAIRISRRLPPPPHP